MPSIKIVFAVLLFALVDGCAGTIGQRATRDAIDLAQAHDFAVTEVEGLGYAHTVFSRLSGPNSPVWVFIEGDGSPWLDDGRKIADDPTARNPLALRLSLQTPGSVLYLGRPCYLRSATDARCVADAWTNGRYSTAVVASMNAAIGRSLSSLQNHSVVLVGYSGGGTLAALMARTNPNVVAVVTIAGNLDTDAWTKQHAYRPLVGSLNPAEESALPPSLMQFHLVGERDVNVTPHMAERYLLRLTSDQIRRYPEFTHTCCWERVWPQIQSDLEKLVATRLSGADSTSKTH